MQINHISLEKFRNFRSLELDLPPGPTLLHGDNAQGKTNLLEAIYYLATTRSPHADHNRQLINWVALMAEDPIIAGRIVAQIESNHESMEVEIRLIREQVKEKPAFRREALINHRKVRLMDLLGKLRVILFLPQDMELVTGSPSKRRRYIDITLCQTDPVYCRALSTFNKVLEQRNALLRQIAEQGYGLDVLPVYTEKLVEAGSQVFIGRSQILTALDQISSLIHRQQLTENGESSGLRYHPRIGAPNRTRADGHNEYAAKELSAWLKQQTDAKSVAEVFHLELNRSQAADIASGVTQIGPHRDDWQFLVNDRDLTNFGSRGQQRTALLALKLAEIQWMAIQTGDRPVLLLDEVVAELDTKRRALLLQTVEESGQSILTATDPGMFPAKFLNRATTMRVVSGRVEPELGKTQDHL